MESQAVVESRIQNELLGFVDSQNDKYIDNLKTPMEPQSVAPLTRDSSVESQNDKYIVVCHAAALLPGSAF